MALALVLFLRVSPVVADHQLGDACENGAPNAQVSGPTEIQVSTDTATQTESSTASAVATEAQTEHQADRLPPHC